MKLHLFASILFFYISLSLSVKAQGPGNALLMDGLDDYAEFSSNNRGITNEVTVEAWIKTSSMGHHHIVSKYDRDGEKGFQLLIQNGKACLAGRDGSGNYRLSGYSTTIVADDNWHHITGVVQNGTWTIYVDGILENQQVTGYTNTVLSSNHKLLLGNYYYIHLGNHYYSGIVDEIKLWKKALSADEIRRNMCQSTPSSSSDLVGYFKLNESTGNTVKDHSALQLDGTFFNVNTANARVTSGAPIGDKSIYRYTNQWDNSLELITDIANFSISRADAGIEGFHLYQINATPNNVTGLPNGQQINEYYGLFKVGEPDKKYKVWFKQYALKCGMKLYRRDNNASTTWSVVADTVGSPAVTYHSTSNYGEYAASGSNIVVPDNSTPAEYFTCFGRPVTLEAPTLANAIYLWNNGQTTPAIQVSTTGTYTVIITKDGCSISTSMIVSNDECPIIPNIITPNGDGKNDAFVVEGVEPLTLEIKIFNRWGKSIYQSVRYDNGWSAEGVPAGLYFYHLTSSRSQNTFRGWLEVIK